MEFIVSNLFVYLQDLRYLQKKSMRNDFTGERLEGQKYHFNSFPLKKSPIRSKKF